MQECRGGSLGDEESLLKAGGVGRAEALGVGDAEA